VCARAECLRWRGPRRRGAAARPRPCRPAHHPPPLRARQAAFVAANPGITFLSEYAPTIANVTNEHFIVWMRVAALPSFRKLYGIINKDIAAGTTIVFNVAAAYPVTGFSGRKTLVLSTTSFLGGKNAFLGIAYIVVGFVCLLLAGLFGVRQLIGGRRLGDTTFLVWHGGR